MARRGGSRRSTRAAKRSVPDAGKEGSSAAASAAAASATESEAPDPKEPAPAAGRGGRRRSTRGAAAASAAAATAAGLRVPGTRSTARVAAVYAMNKGPAATADSLDEVAAAACVMNLLPGAVVQESQPPPPAERTGPDGSDEAAAAMMLIARASREEAAAAAATAAAAAAAADCAAPEPPARKTSGRTRRGAKDSSATAAGSKRGKRVERRFVCCILRGCCLHVIKRLPRWRLILCQGGEHTPRLHRRPVLAPILPSMAKANMGGSFRPLFSAFPPKSESFYGVPSLHHTLLRDLQHTCRLSWRGSRLTEPRHESRHLRLGISAPFLEWRQSCEAVPSCAHSTPSLKSLRHPVPSLCPCRRRGSSGQAAPCCGRQAQLEGARRRGGQRGGSTRTRPGQRHEIERRQQRQAAQAVVRCRTARRRGWGRRRRGLRRRGSGRRSRWSCFRRQRRA